MSSLINRIYTLNNKYDLELKEEPIDLSSLDRNEIAGETVYSCVSPGTELAAYQGLPFLRPEVKYPRVVGYCNIARVIATGKNTNSIRQGDYILNFASHRKYFKCRQDDVIAVIDGHSDLKKSVTVYLYHLAYMAILESGARPGMNVGIVGTGTLGYCAAVMSSQFGFLTSVFTNQEYLKEDFKKKNIGVYNKTTADSLYNRFDTIINTSNSWEDWFLSMNLLRKKGVMVNLGFPGRGLSMPETNPLDSRFFYEKQLTLKTAGYVYEGDIDAADIRFNLKRNIQFLLQMVNENKIDPYEIISKEVNWKDLEELYRFLLERDSKKFTGIVNWQDANH
jgi:threonine dehydrogenase-like Zn-dependent dehydrogenase